jgi:hypothetical protein
MMYTMFDESLKGEISQWGLEKINYVDFFGIKNFLSTFLKKNHDVGFVAKKEFIIFRKFLQMVNL